MNSQSIIVPKISTLPVHEPRARAIVRWLVRKNIINEELTTCGRTGNRMAHAIAEGAREVVLHPQALPFGEPVNGLEIVTKRCIYTPAKGFLGEAGCADVARKSAKRCSKASKTGCPGARTISLPACGHEDDINGFLYLQECGFSNSGLHLQQLGRGGVQAEFYRRVCRMAGPKDELGESRVVTGLMDRVIVYRPQASSYRIASNL